MGRVDAGDLMMNASMRQYELDKIGNIAKVKLLDSTLVHTVDALSGLTAINEETVHHDLMDNLTKQDNHPAEFVFDAFTGVVMQAKSDAGTSTFDYDARDRRRIEHRSPDGVDRAFIWDGNQVVGHGVVDNVSLDVPGDDIDEHIASIDQFGAGSQWFCHQGPDQSTLAVTGSAGLVEAYTYSAFGEVSIWSAGGQPRADSAFGNIFQFHRPGLRRAHGHVFDASTAVSAVMGEVHVAGPDVDRRRRKPVRSCGQPPTRSS
jgi:hypothetical protein